MSGGVIIKGLPGTGKSHILREHVRMAGPAHETLYITFNRELVESTILSNPDYFSKHNAMTIHSLCYRLLHSCGRLPPTTIPSIVPEDFDHTFFDRGELSSFFDSLTKRFLELERDEIKGFLGHRSLIAVDEVQDLSDRLLSVIFHLRRCYSVFAIAGDHLQRIYDFGSNKFTLIPHSMDYVQEIARQLKMEMPPTTLTKNHRSDPGIVNLVNGFLQRTIDPRLTAGYCYFSPDRAGVKPEISIFQNQQSELKYIEELYSKSEIDVLVLARSRRTLRRLPDHITNRSTIAAYKGREAKHIILMGFALESTESLSEVQNYLVGLSRATERLTITSAFPAAKILANFDEATYVLRNDQVPFSKAIRRARPKIVDTFQTLKAYNQASIDSIDLQVIAADVPFSRYVCHEGKPERARNQCWQRSPEGLRYTISFHHGSESYTFRFRDLNPLRFSGFSDAQLLEYLQNIVTEYFDHRISPENIFVSLLHVARVLKFKTKQARTGFLRLLLVELGSQIPRDRIKYISTAKHGVRTLLRASDTAAFAELFALLEGTVYLQPHHETGLVLYDSCNKIANKLPRREDAWLAKVEWRMDTKDVVRQRRFLGEIASSIKALRHHVVSHEDWARCLIRNGVGSDVLELHEPFSTG